jgi:phage protein D
METVKTPRFKVVYEGKDITKDITKNMVQVSYTDNASEQSDEISFTVEDTKGLWRGSWYPAKGDKVSLSIGYGNELLECGTFTVDEIEISGPPDTVTIRALAAAISSPLRTKNSKAHEKQSLRQIANGIAGKYGYTIVATDGSSSLLDNIRIDRVTQNRETDLAFLSRVGGEYGIIFSVRDKKLVFSSIYDIENGQPVLEIDRTDMIRYSFKDKSTKSYKKARVRHKHVSSNENIEFIYDGDEQEQKESGDTLEVHARAENTQQAEAKAKAKLHHANSSGKEANFSVPGNPLLVAGNNVTVTGLGNLSGKFHIKRSTHSISTSGYTTDCEIYKPSSVSKRSVKATTTQAPAQNTQFIYDGNG